MPGTMLGIRALNLGVSSLVGREKWGGLSKLLNS